MLPLLAALLLLHHSPVSGDTPANCTYEDVEGDWIFYESERSQPSSVDCSRINDLSLAPVQKVRLTLKYPNSVVDQFGNQGTWTMVYNQGFEVTVSGRSYFSYSDYKQDGDTVTSFCNQTLPGQGWSHDITVRNWACFSGRKVSKTDIQLPVKSHRVSEATGHTGLVDQVFRQEGWEADLVNMAQEAWVAGVYQELQDLPVHSVVKMMGGVRSRLSHKPRARKTRQKAGKLVKSFLPSSWDWRNVSGANYVSEVRNQGACGSCYAFSSVGMLEARVNIATRNTKKFLFSPQDIVSCSNLAQGCEGGFPYLVAGRYGKDFGVVEEKCNTYKGKDETTCSTRNCLRHYTASYSYVGGYYGGCSEEAMMRALVENGPMSVSFEVYKDFTMYKSGVYHHTGLLTGHPGFTPFELTNHAVLLVGYGHDSDVGEDFWTVKNSWGEKWGEQGYFRIRRGSDECAIEGLAVEAFPIP